MPLYEYQCVEHGVFDEFAAAAASAEPCPCPVCGKQAGRVLSIPRFKQLSNSLMQSHERNEKSRHQPHVCGHGCKHHHGKKDPQQQPQQPKLQSYKGPRPWVVEHA